MLAAGETSSVQKPTNENLPAGETTSLKETSTYIDTLAVGEMFSVQKSRNENLPAGETHSLGETWDERMPVEENPSFEETMENFSKSSIQDAKPGQKSSFPRNNPKIA